ncbi:hypothetical protein DL96DRAFT_1824222 [Flagelloscypha sp. PMI_526]|nr:hypothetical protein DL96DRAFT_1824222 [Flagelloscypha sp. PMI_526]
MFALGGLTGQSEPLQVQEDAESWELFLAWIDPALPLPLGSSHWIENMSFVVPMIDKYLCDPLRATIIAQLKAVSPGLDNDDALRVWILAIRLGTDELAQMVAQKASFVPLSTVRRFPGRNIIPMSAWDALDEYRERLHLIPAMAFDRRDRGSDVFHNASYTWKGPWNSWKKMRKHDEAECTRSKIGGSNSVSYLDWFQEYCNALQSHLRNNPHSKLDLSELPSDCSDALSKAMSCPACSPDLLSEIASFNHGMLACINGAVNANGVPNFLEN